MTHEIISLSHPTGLLKADIALPSSKSETNRALIIQALAEPGRIKLENISDARDSQTMLRLLQSEDLTLDVIDAGTTMRFLTAFCTATGREAILTGTPRMCQRPIGILVDALRLLGGQIEYLKNEGFPPIHIKGFEPKTHQLAIAGNVSSQYISALLMIAPTLPNGIELQLVGDVMSKPYIEMTLQLMSHFGVAHEWEGNTIRVAPQPYQANRYHIESDWSGASYWFSMVALSEDAEVRLLGLKKESLQGDRAIVEIMDQLGVRTVFEKQGLYLTKKDPGKKLVYDFTHCPDLAQTVAVCAAALGIKAELTGLKSLRIKETDRIAALATELDKMGQKVQVIGDEAIKINPQPLDFSNPEFQTYDDHRMAMAFAPLALLDTIRIADPGVVKKSYPAFWKHLDEADFMFSVNE